MALKDMKPIDRIAMVLSTGLMLIGIVVLAIVELLDGAPFGAAPLTNDAGEVIGTPLIDPNIRTGLVILGLVILLLWGIYKVFTPVQETERQQTEQPTAAD